MQCRSSNAALARHGPIASMDDWHRSRRERTVARGRAACADARRRTRQRPHHRRQWRSADRERPHRHRTGPHRPHQTRCRDSRARRCRDGRPLRPHGDSGFHRSPLVESGFSPIEAISAATTTAAAFLYRSDQLGSLRAGFSADLVVLRGQPDRDVTAIRTVERVMVAGQWIDTSKYREY